MKKFFISLLILLILGGVGFFFGWAQLAVPPGSWGVIRSKTHGLDRNLIQEGEFRWVWYKLIPTNVEILVFSPPWVSRSVLWQGELPSGSVYASLSGLNADFSWEIRAELSFSLKPSSVPALVEERNITSQEDLDRYAGERADEIQAYAQRRLLYHAENGGTGGEFPFFPGSSGGEPGFPRALEEEIYESFPDIESLSFPVRSARFPDFELYRSARLVYEEYLRRQRDFFSSDVNRAAELRLSSRFRFDELEKYGELLTRYPILLRYLALEEGLPLSGEGGEAPLGD
jgi:hypothetical protein